ncbi:glycosyltransferase involved in cell wall biosynthesis [Knoellia remsis]|uniref:Glycosyltransferase involved in cell wall biosynthesis n=1 Tax=Knoellia remsis TaxID=407159 RepID=A0A2T0UZ55_9MICO|nr:glycosyltransferase family 4 protein [Knoellia remsis]PRY63213.1 glycosyltransferase involved in cell wall biosynthesis [Knoellia remsis]
MAESTSYAVPPTALWVVPVAELGGVARHVLDVARAGIPGYRLVVMCPEGPLADELRQREQPVVTGDLGPSAGLARSVRTVRRVVRALRPAVVHSHLSHADITCAVATVGLDTALVSTEHGIAADRGLYQASSARARLMVAVHTARMRRFDAVIAVSRATADLVRSTWLAGSRVRVVHNGVDRPAQATERRDVRDGIHVVSLSRLAPEKGLDDLIDAFALVARDDPGARLTLAGTGELRDALTAKVAGSGLMERVSLPGHVDPGPLLAQGDVLVQLSRSENMSYSILDAAAAGLGVVATAVGGNPEVLPPRCLVDAADPEQVARTIREQATDPGLRPGLPRLWPTVADMASDVGGTYAEVTR